MSRLNDPRLEAAGIEQTVLLWQTTRNWYKNPLNASLSVVRLLMRPAPSKSFVYGGVEKLR